MSDLSVFYVLLSRPAVLALYFRRAQPCLNSGSRPSSKIDSVT